MDRLTTRDILEGALAGTVGFTLGFYVMGLDGTDAMYVGGIATVSKLIAGMTLDNVMHVLSGVTLSGPDQPTA